MSPMRGLSRVLIGVLAIDVAMFGLAIVLDATEIGALERSTTGSARPGEMASIVARQESFAGGFFLILVATTVIWMIWQFRGQRNLLRARRAGVRFTPGWAVGWWFIPIVNLWKPFQSVRELWMRSDPSDRASRGWWVIGVWWAAFLVANFLFSTDAEAPTAEAVIATRKATIVGAAVGIAATLLAISIVRATAQRQEAIEPWVPSRPDLPPAWPGLPAPPG